MERYTALALGEERVVRYCGRPYLATVVEISPTRYRARFTTGTGTKTRWFGRPESPEYWERRRRTYLADAEVAHANHCYPCEYADCHCTCHPRRLAGFTEVK